MFSDVTEIQTNLRLLVSHFWQNIQGDLECKDIVRAIPRNYFNQKHTEVNSYPTSALCGKVKICDILIFDKLINNTLVSEIRKSMSKSSGL